ncbi:hypothetical protein [Streptomyces parvus]|nr:hypothetical protein [Streptomyces parvus]
MTNESFDQEHGPGCMCSPCLAAEMDDDRRAHDESEGGADWS